MAKTHSEKQFTQMSGEFGVVSELFRRQFQATLTYGNSKSADVFVIAGKGARAAKIEVKTCSIKEWIVGAQADDPQPHVVWVFVYMPKPVDTVSRAQVAEMGKSSPSYHVLTSKEVFDMYSEKKSKATHEGPIVFTFGDLQFNTNQWHKIEAALNRPAA